MLFFQHKGFTYHYIPFDIAALLCLLIVGLSAAKRERADRLSVAEATAPLPGSQIGDESPGRFPSAGRHGARLPSAACSWPSSAEFWRCGSSGGRDRRGPTRRNTRRCDGLSPQHTHPGDRVLMMATSTRPAYPMLVQLGCRPSSRYSARHAVRVSLLSARTRPAAGRSTIATTKPLPKNGGSWTSFATT